MALVDRTALVMCPAGPEISLTDLMRSPRSMQVTRLPP